MMHAEDSLNAEIPVGQGDTATYGRVHHRTAIGFMVAACICCGQATAQDTEDAQDADESESFFDAVSSGKVDFNLRLRYEFVSQDALEDAHAATARLRLGYGTRPWNGLSFYAGLEASRPADYSSYNAAGLNGQPGKAVIADPKDTDLDQLWVNYDFDKIKTEFKLGRQVINLDDVRFVGDVAWRQLRQTFDAVSFTSTPVEDLTVFYAYVTYVNRVFGSSSGMNFQSDSHLVNVAYDGFSFGTVTGFGYFLDFDNAAASSSNTVGLRFNGKHEFTDKFSLGYALSYAYQSNADSNPTDYDASYYLVDVSGTLEGLGALGLAFEVLGSDNGVAAFQTPLATGHKFNGWADAFLTTPAAGLQDLYVYVNADLPWDVKGRIAWHKFDADDGGADFGNELDLLLSKKLTKNWTVLAKFAAYDGASGGLADRTKFWIQTTFSF